MAGLLGVPDGFAAPAYSDEAVRAMGLRGQAMARAYARPKPPPAAPRPAKKPGGGSLLANLPALLDMATARGQATDLLAPIFAAQDQRINQNYAGRSDAIRQAYEALAGVGREVGPAIQQAYQGASRDTAAFAKGVSDALASIGQGAATDATAQIAAQGGPQTVTSGLADGGAAALYGMGGAIPASQLAREGAAFTSAASFLPSTAAGLGIEALRDMDASRLNELRQLEAERPGTVLDMMNQLVERSDARRKDATGLALEQRDYRTKQAQAKQERIDRQYEAAALKLAYGMKLSKREKRLLNTYGLTPEAVEAAGKAAEERADDARAAAAAKAKDDRAAARQAAGDRAQAAREAAKDARAAMLEARKAAARSGLEKDKQRYRVALERFKAANRRKLQTQKDAAALRRKRAAPGKGKGTVGNPGDSYFGG